MKVKKQNQKSLYRKLILRMFMFLIIPFIIVTLALYVKVIGDGEKNYLSSIALLTGQAESVREQHIESLLRISDRISSNASLVGFLLTGYSNERLEYYFSQITQMAMSGLSYDDVYIPKLYVTNQTIPRGFQMFYHLSDIETIAPVKDFLDSAENAMWVTPMMAKTYSASVFTPFREHYTYIKKVFADDRLVFLLTLSVHKDVMDSFLSQTYDTALTGNQQILETPERLIVNCSDSTFVAGESNFIDEQFERLKNDGYTTRSIEFPQFPQTLLYVLEPNQQSKYIAFGVVLLILLFAGIISIVVPFIRKIFQNIFFCIEQFENSVKSGFMTRLTVYGDNEITKIEIAFNSLIDKIQELMKLSTEQGSLAKESQLKALQQQINPHFMYNTLEVFAYKMELYRHYNEADAMVSFANMLRYNTVSNEKYATVGEELEQVNNYLHIQQIKYDNIDFQAVVPAELHNRAVIRFILQPLIENSFTHGYCGKPLRILLSCVDLGEQILFEICDNGKGMTKEELESINSSLADGKADDNMGIGLKNINMRLHLFYSDKYTLRLDSKENSWTMVTFKIPKS